MFRCDVHLGSNHKKAPNTWNFTISKKAQTIWQHTWGSSACILCAWSEPLDLSSTHIQNRLRKAIFVCVVLAESLACFLQFTRDSPQTVTEYNISYTFRHCCLIPPATINDFFFPKEIIKIISVVLQYARTRCRCVENIKAKKLHSTDSSFLVNWCMNSFNRWHFWEILHKIICKKAVARQSRRRTGLIERKTFNENREKTST